MRIYYFNEKYSYYLFQKKLHLQKIIYFKDKIFYFQSSYSS